jgi:hypothetical protein
MKPTRPRKPTSPRTLSISGASTDVGPSRGPEVFSVSESLKDTLPYYRGRLFALMVALLPLMTTEACSMWQHKVTVNRDRA